MIPILFETDITDFSTYGIGALQECTYCEVTEERNGEYECKLKYPISGKLYNEIKPERIIKAKPNETSKDQPFRIYRITTPINGEVTIYAQHISYDLGAIAVTPFTLNNTTPTQAIECALRNSTTNSLFTFTSDYLNAKDFIVDKPKSIRALLGGSEGSILSLWGGEFEWDNYSIKHREHRGQDNGVVIEYGKNLTKFEKDNDFTGLYSLLLPYAIKTYDDETTEVITLSEVTLPINTQLNAGKSVVRDFTDDFEQGSEITEQALRAKATAYLEAHPLGIENPTIDLSFEPLLKDSDYSDILERVALCDIVTVKHSELNVEIKTRVVKTIYNTLAEKYTSITLGSRKANLATDLGEIKDEVKKTTKAVDRFPTFVQAAVEKASKLITGQTGGYVVLNGDGGGQPYELLVMDRPNKEEAVNVWRWNVNGLGFSNKGYNGPYETAITSDGQIVADFITSGTLLANIIKAGVISSKDGSSYWNLDTGEVHFNSYAEKETVDGIQTSLSSLTQTANEISAEVKGKVDEDNGENQSFGWSIKPNRMLVYSGGVPVLTINSEGLTVNGCVNATSGAIGNLTIDDYLYFGGNRNYYINSNDEGTGYYIYLPGIKVDNSTATFSGTLSAPNGTIGGFTITNRYLCAGGKQAIGDMNDGVYIGTNGISLGSRKFAVTADGKMTATNATITGTINATAGKIGGFAITDEKLTNDSGNASITINYKANLPSGTVNARTYISGISVFSGPINDRKGGWLLDFTSGKYVFTFPSNTAGAYPGIKFMSLGNNEVAITEANAQEWKSGSGTTGTRTPFRIGMHRISNGNIKGEWGSYIAFEDYNKSTMWGSWYYYNPSSNKTFNIGNLLDYLDTEVRDAIPKVKKFYFWTYASACNSDTVVSCTYSTHGINLPRGAIVIPRSTATSTGNLSGYSNITTGTNRVGVTISGSTVYVCFDDGSYVNGFYCLIYGND